MAKKGGGKWWVMTPARKAYYASKKKGGKGGVIGSQFARGYKSNLKELASARKHSIKILKTNRGSIGFGKTAPLHPEARKKEIQWLKKLSTPSFRKSYARKNAIASLGSYAKSKKSSAKLTKMKSILSKKGKY